MSGGVIALPYLLNASLQLLAVSEAGRSQMTNDATPIVFTWDAPSAGGVTGTQAGAIADAKDALANAPVGTVAEVLKARVSGLDHIPEQVLGHVKRTEHGTTWTPAGFWDGRGRALGGSPAAARGD
jgi:allophanate hydrolase subunit 2